jgi:hypothetical protein
MDTLSDTSPPVEVAIADTLRWLDRVCNSHTYPAVQRTYAEARNVRQQLRDALARLRSDRKVTR